MSTLPTKHSGTATNQYFSTDDMKMDNTDMGKGNKPQKNDKANKKPKQVKTKEVK